MALLHLKGILSYSILTADLFEVVKIKIRKIVSVIRKANLRGNKSF